MISTSYTYIHTNRSVSWGGSEQEEEEEEEQEEEDEEGGYLGRKGGDRKR